MIALFAACGPNGRENPGGDGGPSACTANDTYCDGHRRCLDQCNSDGTGGTPGFGCPARPDVLQRRVQDALWRRPQGHAVERRLRLLGGRPSSNEAVVSLGLNDAAAQQFAVVAANDNDYAAPVHGDQECRDASAIRRGARWRSSR